MIALSTSRALLPAFEGPESSGVAVGSGYLEFADRVLAMSRPGGPKMPNGVEAAARAELGMPALIGRGRLLVGKQEVIPGDTWEPVPVVRHLPTGGPPLRPDPDRLAGRGPGLTPAGDDILCGYVAGLFLFHGRREEASAIAQRAAPLTTRLSATLLYHAAVGELPEPAHAYLGTGDAAPLVAFGHSSGPCLLLGLAMAATAPSGPPVGFEVLRGFVGIGLSEGRVVPIEI